MSLEDSRLPGSNHRVDSIDARISAEQRVRKSFYDNGTNVKQWALAHGFNPGLVYSVLRGERKCLRGQSHQVAVALGLKSSGA